MFAIVTIESVECTLLKTPGSRVSFESAMIEAEMHVT
jgi:hypothetical protein